MDKELAALEEWFVNGLNEYEVSGNYGDSELKRIKRFGNEVVNNIEMYGNLLEAARSEGLSIKGILGEVRSIENKLLDEASSGTKTSRKQMLSDVIHHIYAQRTGGDTLRNLSQVNRAEARNMLRAEFGRFGNVPENLYSLFRSWHTKQEKAKGLEQRALQELGYEGKAGDLPTIKAHQTASSSRLISGTVQGATTAREAVEGMRPQFQLQQQETMAALEQSNALMDDLDAISGSTYNPGMSAEELAVRRSILTANPEQVIAAIKNRLGEFTSQPGFDFSKGASNFKAGGVGAIAGLLSSPDAMGMLAAGDINGALKTAGIEMAVGEGISLGLQGLASRAPQVLGAVAPALQGAGTVGTVSTIPEVTARVMTKGEKGAQELQAQSGTAAVAASLGPVSPLLGQSAANAPVDEKRNQERLEIEARSEAARQRGGRFKLFGGAVTLPEFGLSEMLEIN